MSRQNNKVTFTDVLYSTLFFAILGIIIWDVADLTLPFQANIFRSIVLGSLFGVALYLCLAVICFKVKPIAKLMAPLLRQIVKIYPAFTLTQILIISALAGFGEELLMRGILQVFITEHLGVFLGILIASLVFGLLHFLSLIYVVTTFLIGCLFGVAFHLTQDLLLVMVAHAVYDVFAFIGIKKVLLKLSSGE